MERASQPMAHGQTHLRLAEN